MISQNMNWFHIIEATLKVKFRLMGRIIESELRTEIQANASCIS